MYKQVWEEISGLHGCLAHLRTGEGRRQFSSDSDPLTMKNLFVSDEAKITSSKAFRLLRFKTQVLTAPIDPFIRSRETHVMEVVACSVVIAELLGLNIDLVRAIALGHDIGHVPFGHPGEHFLAEAMGRKEFCHEVMGPLIAQKIERQGLGLNLCFETLDGMMRHSGDTAREGMTQEAWVVRWADKIAYLFADYNDISRRMKFPLEQELKALADEFGLDHRERTSTAIAALIVESAACGKVSFENSIWGHKFKKFRSLMMTVYVRVTQQDLRAMMEPVLEFLTQLKIGDPFLMFALMTDQDVIRLARNPSRNITHLRDTALGERLDYLGEYSHLDICNPYLNW
ncbi:MAG: hypothetical protein JWN89_288 [Parcubacteria group bacterium]|nr:hypothetical protein [Parcubacteria group bacterium]